MDSTTVVAAGRAQARHAGYQWLAAEYHLHHVKQGKFDYSAFVHNPGSFEYGYVTDDLPTR